jgi:glutaminyl-peptide cyclotransferase
MRVTVMSVRCRRVLPLVLGVLACGGDREGNAAPRDRAPTVVRTTPFEADSALSYVRTQLAFGPRVPGSSGHRRTGDWIVMRLRERADTVIEQRWTHRAKDGKLLPLRNILARFRPEATERVLLLAHWDTRPVSDAADDPAQRTIPVPGANDGGSGVAVLLAIADQLRRQPARVGVDLLFVDGEDYGDFPTDTDVLLGSRYFADHLPSADYRPLFGVLLDMVGDADLRLPYEGHSLELAPEVVQRVWGTARTMGHESIFVPQSQGPVTDDHLPLLRKGLRVVNVIDLQYCCHHKPTDTIDKVSARSLKIVGDVILQVIRDV